MITKIFLLPLILCLLWGLYLKNKGWELKQGKQGFILILSIGGVIGAYFTLMLWLTSL